MLLLLNWAGPALACRLASIVLQATAGGAYSPVRPILLLAVRPGGAEKASPGLSFGVNAGLKFPRSDVRFGR